MPEMKKFSKLIYLCAKAGYVEQAARLFKKDPDSGLVDADAPI